ncbi:TRAP transporter small permease [Fusobacterium perfoetens]|uniref:TRAP transporter small permease n=1 Tax=Fusobacterium perfoetens TaxID=852 RepID=UPI000687FFFA|nr:TRAP transporter small permease [Fusobacterium perfoetens]MCI6152239.1 TRAP transporter small permease [Fusobacterium perfoetens]MDY3237489.1 TRAP transporter small permease [Fusobacterium perfoetens]
MKKIISNILNLDLVIAGIALIILIIITFFGSIMRYFFNNPIIWQEEVQLGLAIWVIFYGASAAFRYSSHIAIDMIVDLFPERIQKIIEIFIAIITISTLVFILKNGCSLVQQFINTNRTTNILHIPSQYIYSAIPIGCLLMIINYILVEIKEIFGIELIEFKKEEVDGD